MSKPIVLAVVGAVLGAAVAFAGFTFLTGGTDSAEAQAPAQVVSVPGKLGPHITLEDRVFNLLTLAGQPPAYLKLQTVIEFETRDARWEHALTSCGQVATSSAAPAAEEPSTTETPAATSTESPDAGLRLGGGTAEVLVSSMPGGAAIAPAAASGGDAEGGSPCEQEQEKLLAEFEGEIGSGRTLMEDAVTTIVSGHTAAEIATPAGKEALKAEIAEAVDALIQEPPVTRVLFLNFITQ